MLEGLLTILACQLVGTLLVGLLRLPIPGPIVGMLLLLIVLCLRSPAPDHPMLRAGERILSVLPLLFVPAGVGVLAAFGQIRQHAATMVIGLVVPWLLSVLAAAGAGAAACRWTARGDGQARESSGPSAEPAGEPPAQERA